MIAGEHEHDLGAVLIENVEILENRIGGAAIPNLAEFLLRGHELDELAELAVEVSPAALHVPNQGLRLILRQYDDLP